MKKLLKNATAASAIEYGLLASLIGVVSLGSVFQFGTNARDTFNGLSNTVESRVLGQGAQGNGTEGNNGVEGGVATIDCYDPDSVGLVGNAGVCDGMLIVDNATLRGAASTHSSVGGNGTFAILGPDDNIYTFEDSAFNVFTGQVTDMSWLFVISNFNGDIGYWDISNVVDMNHMFSATTAFNQDIGSWDTSSVPWGGMVGMFAFSTSFNQDLSRWCVTNIASAPSLFNGSSNLLSINLPIWGTCPGS